MTVRTTDAVRLLKEALRLRMHGERAPGGSETWREWDRKAEAFLRALGKADISERAEEIHAEHHAGYIVPSLDSCPEHTRAEYEALAYRVTKEDE